MSNSLSPVQRLTTLGGDVINLATSASVRSCKRRGLHLRAQLKSQEKR
ncbi:MAG: hypothetical protein WCD82_22090 [Xanthobacteraceae bacterium]|jgi:hypothetical protein